MVDWFADISENLAASSYKVLLITSRHELHRKHRSSVAVYGPLPSKGSICHSIHETRDLILISSM
jgi:hypothetical protein